MKQYATSNGRLFKTFLLLIGLACLTPAGAQTLSSKDKNTIMLELYTSQGCSSCPPAERWLSKFTGHKQLWTKYIPINFHVDYWDYLGWRDPFAQAIFTERQRTFKRLGLSTNVATPGFIVNGEGWNGWFSGLSLPPHPLPGTRVLTANINGDNVMIQYEGKEQNLVAHLAVLGFDINITVKAGENKGKALQHDFVVIGYKQTPLDRIQGQLRAGTTLPSAPSTRSKTRAIAIWLEQRGSPKPIQAVAGYLSGS